MSVDIEPQVNTNSAEFKQGVEAGLNSAEDSKDWQAGNELGQELKESDNIETVSENLSPALFMRGHKAIRKTFKRRRTKQKNSSSVLALPLGATRRRGS